MSGTQLLTQSVNHPLLRLLLEGATIGKKKKPYDAWILFRWWRILSSTAMSDAGILYKIHAQEFLNTSI